ncbi:hypothetical protein KEM52_004327, partial [Ascosphaera acerosa]
LPRIGGRNWSASTAAENSSSSGGGGGGSAEEDVTWTATRVRGHFLVVKFGAKNFEVARDWLSRMVREEGSIGREFGEDGYG